MPGLIVGIDPAPRGLIIHTHFHITDMRGAAEDVRTDNPTVTARPVRGKNTPSLGFMRCEASAGNANGPRAACGKAGRVVAVAPTGWQWLLSPLSEMVLCAARWQWHCLYNSLFQPKPQPTHAETDCLMISHSACGKVCDFLFWSSFLLVNFSVFDLSKQGHWIHRNIKRALAIFFSSFPSSHKCAFFKFYIHITWDDDLSFS